MSTMTIRDLEVAVQTGLEALRTLRLNTDAESAKELLLPEGLTPVVELVNDNLRKKRSSAAAWNWNPLIDRVIISFKPQGGQAGPSLGQDDSLCAKESTPQATVPPSEGTSFPEAQKASPIETPDSAFAESKDNAGQLATAQEVIECCQALAQAERSNRHFIALKWFRDELLSTVDYAWAQSAHRRQQVLTQAIMMGRIDLRKIPNPKNPDHPTTAVSLNRAIPIPGVTSRFRPVPIRGEVASATLLADRGSL